MPELPEVETIARQLNSQLSGLLLQEIEIFDSKRLSLDSGAVSGRKVRSVSRLGKQILFVFEKTGRRPGSFLAAHLRMSGRLVWSAAGESAETKHLRARFRFKGGELLFIDPRRFGTLQISSDVSAFQPKGAEPLAGEFTPQRLAELMTRSKAPLKQILLRQDLVVGIGNIYASEILFRAGLDPRRGGSGVSAQEIKKLHRAIGAVLEQAIKLNGTTFSDFADAAGREGGFQRFLRVYDREGERCRRCEGIVERIVQGGRSTFFCVGCQR